jgi:DNA-binding MarR family transcriptional regulator
MNKPALWINAGAQRQTNPAGHPRDGAAGAPQGETDERIIQRIVAARRARERIVGSDLFADPAWDLLLELYAASLAQRRVSVSDLSVASSVPATTSLRWLDKLESVGLIERIDDPLDSRRVWVEISAGGRTKMRAWIDTVRPGIAGN